MNEEYTKYESRTCCSLFVVFIKITVISFTVCSYSLIKFFLNIKSMKGKDKNYDEKEKRIDAIARDLPRLDTAYYKKGDYPGLELWIYPSGKKTWRFQYRTKNKNILYELKLETIQL